MTAYPINLDVTGRDCLVVGGGGVGARKARGLLDCSAAVTVVSPEISPALRELAASGRVNWAGRGYRSEDMAGRFLAFAACGDAAVNERVVTDARRAGVLCNAADRPEAGDFTLPAVLRRGSLAIAVSSGGASPALSRRIRMTLEETFGPEYETALDLLGAARRRLLAREHDPEDHRRRFRALLDGGLLALLRNGEDAAADRLLREILGSGFDLKTLTSKETDDPAPGR
jgi:precorrin-2 dehydrogenase/sirohydrochlorin ferrochelatase